MVHAEPPVCDVEIGHDGDHHGHEWWLMENAQIH
jgi:hypothetical protein